LSLRHIEEMMTERGVVVDHTTVHRWAVKMLPILAAVMRRRKRPVGLSWRMDETYVKVGGQWKYLYRAVDRSGQTIDFLLRAHRDYAAARCFFERAIDLHGVPESITIDKSGANTGGDRGTPSRLGCGHRDAAIEVPQQPHRAGPPSRQAHRATHARVQERSLRASHHRRHRDDAHDQEAPA
jgi:transposase-like protein